MERVLFFLKDFQREKTWLLLLSAEKTKHHPHHPLAGQRQPKSRTGAGRACGRSATTPCTSRPARATDTTPRPPPPQLLCGADAGANGAPSPLERSAVGHGGRAPRCPAVGKERPELGMRRKKLLARHHQDGAVVCFQAVQIFESSKQSRERSKGWEARGPGRGGFFSRLTG